jgi:tetratricopeptide (TPR) repeat protein
MITLLIVAGMMLLSGRGISVLVSNLSLVRLLPGLIVLPPRPDEMLGWTDRPGFTLSADQQGFMVALDRVQSPRTRASILALTGQLPAAERLLQTSPPGDALARFWLAFVYGQQHRSDEALELLRSVPGIEGYFAEPGFRAEGRGDYERAMRLLETAAALESGAMPDRSRLYGTLTRTAYNYLGDWNAAVRWGERWIQAVPDNTDAYTWLAALYLWHSQPEQAYKVLQRGEPYGVSSHRFYPGHMGQIYQSRGQWDLAIEAYRKSWEQNKDSPGMVPNVAWYLGFALYHEGRFEEARPYLEIVERTGALALQQAAASILTQMGAKKPP